MSKIIKSLFVRVTSNIHPNGRHEFGICGKFEDRIEIRQEHVAASFPNHNTPDEIVNLQEHSPPTENIIYSNTGLFPGNNDTLVDTKTETKSPSPKYV